MKPPRPWLHCIGGRVERWATLAPPSFVIIARSARSASRVLPLKKSVISCSTAPDFFPELQSSRVLCLPQLLLNCRPCTQRQQQPTSLEVSWVEVPILSDALRPEFLESDTYHYLACTYRPAIGHQAKKNPLPKQTLQLCSLRPRPSLGHLPPLGPSSSRP